MSDEMTPFETTPCTDCIQDEGTPTAVTRRDIIRKYGLRGVLMVIAGAGALKVGTVKAGYVYMGAVYRNCYCYSPCQQHCDYCEMWRNEYGQVQYRNCDGWLLSKNCCAAFGKPSTCCG